MRTVSYRLGDLARATINIGKVAENEYTRVQFNADQVFAEYPSATPSMAVISPAGVKYPAVVTREGNLIIWDVTDADLTAEGMGELQLTLTENGVVCKSFIARTRIERSIVADGEAPDPVQNWLDEAAEVLEQVEDAIPAGGTQGQVLGKLSDDDYDMGWIDQTGGGGGGGGTSNYNDLSNKPQIAGTTLSGNKTLEQLGIAAASDIPDVSGFYTKPASGIPAADLASGVIPDVSGFYTKPASGIPASDLASGVIPDVSGFYTKPAGGIPKSDLASGVQTSLGKADTAYQKPAGGIPATDLASGVIPDVSGFYTKPAGGIPASDIASGVIPDPEDLIDDTAGDGDTDKVWSADKTAALSSAIANEVPQTKHDSASGVDLDVCDEDGNVLVRFKDGHIKTKEFDSSSLVDVSEARKNPLFTTIDFWEPSEVDDGYSNPTADYGQDTKRADWSATDKYYYYEFLAHYYDGYLGVHSDGYRVTKRSLGQDSSQLGYELFEYDFCPLNYKYTIMLSAGMNADETQGIWGLATFMRGIMNKEETNMEIAYNNIRFKVIPIINAYGFDQATLRYTYSDGVNPNYNFNYKDSWSRHTATTTQKGSYPDSNVSTVILKNWINENSGKADLWIDLHTGRWGASYPNKKILDVRVADSSMVSLFSTYETLIKNYYIAKGYVESTDSIGGASSIRDNLDYQKSVYAYDVCGIKAIMPEMHLESTGYGADGFTNNSTYGIKCYVGQIRAMMMCYINASVSANGSKLPSVETVRLHS